MMAADPLAVALARAAAEQRERGYLSASSLALLRTLTGGEPEQDSHSHRHHWLDGRDELIGELTGYTSSTSTWGAAGEIAGWLRRWCVGDPLDDLHPACLRLVSRVGERLSQRQVYRILAGDRSA